jgi:hypothetical protein
MTTPMRPLHFAFLLLCASMACAQERRNFFNDPFEQVTHGLAGCPVPEPPLMTEAEMRAQTHWRAERGTSCFQSGRCRLPNAYLYDREIIARAARYLAQGGAFEGTSVWIEGQRRIVFLKGCVNTAAQSAELERLARNVDDVESVVNLLMIGTTDQPNYPVAAQVRP